MEKEAPSKDVCTLVASWEAPETGFRLLPGKTHTDLFGGLSMAGDHLRGFLLHVVQLQGSALPGPLATAPLLHAALILEG